MELSVGLLLKAWSWLLPKQVIQEGVRWKLQGVLGPVLESPSPAYPHFHIITQAKPSQWGRGPYKGVNARMWRLLGVIVEAGYHRIEDAWSFPDGQGRRPSKHKK